MAGFSFPTTIASFTLLGFDVRLVDTELAGFNLDPDALTPRQAQATLYELKRLAQEEKP